MAALGIKSQNRLMQGRGGGCCGAQPGTDDVPLTSGQLLLTQGSPLPHPFAQQIRTGCVYQPSMYVSKPDRQEPTQGRPNEQQINLLVGT